jgi:hypothetical protein
MAAMTWRFPSTSTTAKVAPAEPALSEVEGDLLFSSVHPI